MLSLDNVLGGSREFRPRITRLLPNEDPGRASR
jgi:hypothetical protein